MGDFDSILPEVKQFYEKKLVPMIIKKDQEFCDLEKCLYIAIEKLAVLKENEGYNTTGKSFSMIILGSSGGRIDHTFSTFHNVFKYINTYSDHLKDTEIYMVSKNAISVFLKNGSNQVNHCKSSQDFKLGFSIIPINGEGNIQIFEEDSEKEGKFFVYLDIYLKFGEKIYIHKKKLESSIKIFVENENTALLYTSSIPLKVV